MAHPLPNHDSDGGDPPCWSHLFDVDATEIDDDELVRLVHELADGVIVADTSGRIVFWNPAATRIFGWTGDDVLGRSLDLIIPPKHRNRHWIGYERVVTEGSTRHEGWLLEVPALHREGHTISIAFTVSLMRRGGAGPVTGIAAVIRDDTARWTRTRQLEAELAHLRSVTSSEVPHP